MSDEKKPLKTLEEMTEEERKNYDSLPEAKRLEYDAKLQMQIAKQNLENARKMETEAKEKRKADREKEKGVKAIISDLKKGELQPEGIAARLSILKVTEAEEIATLTERITKAATARQQNLTTPQKPAFSLTHSFLMAKKEDFLQPRDGGKPDAALLNSYRKYGIISPFLAKTVLTSVVKDGKATGETEQKLYIIDGKRRYWLLPDTEEKDGQPVFEPVPVVIVSGFPEEKTEEKAEIVVNRIRSLNVLATAQMLMRLKKRGVEDTELRKDIGFRTGEIEKITSVFTALIPEIQTLLLDGRLVETTAMSVAKLPKDLQGGLFADYQKRLAEDENARISETNVEEIRQKRAKDAVQRDAGELSGLTNGVEDFKAPEETETPETPALPESGKDSKTEVDTGGENAVNSTNAAPKKAGKKKASDKETPSPEVKADWQENALIALGNVREEMPQDAKVWEAFKALVESVEGTTETGYAASPDVSAPVTVKVGKKEVENLSENRKGWKPKAEKALGDVYNALGTDAPDACFAAYDTLDKALKAANV